jgi:acetoin utilization deacetylase AcuC-like enzyme
MTTLYYTHTSMLEHNTGGGHPERPDRLRSVWEALEAQDFAALDRHEAPFADLAPILRVHPQSHIDAVMAAIPKEGRAKIDADTVVSAGSREAALRAVGAVTAAVDSVIAGEGRNAFCAIRPPGHHAEPDRAMGFCLFNNVAIAAMQAREHGLRRIAVVDFDVHHGNGTEAYFAPETGLFYASTHQSPFYPGTGNRSQNSPGRIVNVPIARGQGSDAFRGAFTGDILPALRAFEPEFLIISAGFDAHRDDPLANLELDEDDFVWVTTELKRVAGDRCAGRIVSVLEGGYDLDALAASCAAHVRVLMEA